MIFIMPKDLCQKKFPLPMSGEGGIEHRTMSGFCV